MGKHNVKLREVVLPNVFADEDRREALTRLQRRLINRRLAMTKAGAGLLLVPLMLVLSIVAARPAGTTYQEIKLSTASATVTGGKSVAAIPKAKLTAAVAVPKSQTKGIPTNRSSQPVQNTLAMGPPAPTSKWAEVLNRYLAGSPMAGHGQTFYEAATANGLDPRLSLAIAKVESGLGRAIPGGFNAYGMTAGTAPGHGRIGSWQAFTSWEDAIISNNNFIRSHWGPGVGPYQMRGYASAGTWAQRVAGVMASIPAPTN